ncbi:DUF4410 domain-containing protein [Paraburkholderia bryophila]|uniref:DUF4410 domain-containing protein n=1 Tax=Paraburkholderia bryophila TaxID=420952 RepID=A0A7Z0B0G4_9BURK|nr:DUF4410 domain-containing protein [Paraburkholderia bryophila]NYH16731.1 hypothetical protein [Paraburkholderia bryophila]
MKPKLIVAMLVAVVQMQGAHAQSSVGNFWTGSAKVQSIEQDGKGRIVPKPDRVAIHDFTVRLDAVSLDRSIAGRLRRNRLLKHGKDADSTPEVLAQHVQAAFGKALTDQLENDHIAVATTGGADAEHRGTSLVVDGEFTAIDEGSKSVRVMIGLGSGASDLKAHVTVSSVTAGHSTVMLAFDLDSTSGKKPGAISSLGTGSLAVGAAEKAVGDRKSTVDADATHMAKLVAKQVESLMGEQPAPAGPSRASGCTRPVGRSAS